MPETRIEKGVFVLGVIAIAALGFLVVRLWHHTRDAAAASSTTSLVQPARTTPGTQTVTSRRATTRTGPADRTKAKRSAKTHSSETRPPKTRPATTRTSTIPSTAGVVSLLLTARADTWLEIRSGSSTGPVLYNGTLPAASTKAFRARLLWARFGAAANLSARLNGKSFRLPSGTYDATFDDRGLRQTGA